MLFHPITNDIFDHQIVRKLEFELKNPRSIDGVVGSRTQSQLVIAKDQLRLMIDDQAWLDRLGQHSQPKRRAIVYIVHRRRAFELRVDLGFIDTQ